jgi:hypothetical protein
MATSKAASAESLGRAAIPPLSGHCARAARLPPPPRQARTALANLRSAVDTLIVIPNDRLLSGEAPS